MKRFLSQSRLFAVTLLLLFAVACAPAEPTMDQTEEEPIVDVVDAPPAPATEGASIAEVAADAGSFETLLAALTAAGLAETFADSDAGPFTVFAPTDDAFAALPAGTVEALLEDPEGALTDILTYHVVEGAVTAETVVTLDAATTLLGQDVSIAVVDGGVVLNDSVNVIVTDIEADNGIIHVIDAVLLPPSEMAVTTMAEPEMVSEVPPTIAEIVTDAGAFNTLVAAVTAAGLADTFADPDAGPFTLLAPTDSAFSALPDGTLETLLADPSGALATILTYHAIEGAALAETVITLDAASTLSGEEITIEVVDGRVVINGTVNVIATDFEASNGVIHIIDAVLIPPSILAAMGSGDADMAEETADTETEEAMPTIAEIAVDAGSFNTLVAALGAAGLAETFADPDAGPFTVLAPTDSAFAALPEGTLETLLADPSGALTTILTYHVIEGAVMAETVVTLDAASTLSGEEITIEVVNGGVVINGSVNVFATDVKASNGVIHIIDAVLIPPSILAAVGGGDADMAGEDAEEETEAALPTIAQAAIDAGQFTSLIAALQMAELDGVFADPDAGPFTVFAPVDSAFAALPDGTIETLLKDESGALANVLTYHVVEGVVNAETVVTLDSATTLQGQTITIEVIDGGVVLNGSVNVLVTDIEASNGIIHVINSVLLP